MRLNHMLWEAIGSIPQCSKTLRCFRICCCAPLSPIVGSVLLNATSSLVRYIWGSNVLDTWPENLWMLVPSGSTHIHIYINTYICTYMYTYIYIYIYTAEVYIYVYIRIHMGTNICIYVYMYMCICIHVYIYIYIYQECTVSVRAVSFWGGAVVSLKKAIVFVGGL